MELNQLTVGQQMVEEFQCPGCTLGSDINCGSYRPTDLPGQHECKSHSAGTMLMGLGTINLGLPKGFNRNGPVDKSLHRSIVRLYTSIDGTFYNRLNVPVWGMEKDGYLFVRCYCPRTNVSYSDVIRGAKLSDLPGQFHTIDVAEFIDEID